jgi:hypothetical protein
LKCQDTGAIGSSSFTGQKTLFIFNLRLPVCVSLERER